MCVCGGAHLHCTRALSSCQRSKKISFQLSITRFAISFWYRPICTPPPLFFDENKKTMHVSNDHSEWGVGVDVGGRAAPSPIQNCQQASTWRAKHWKEITCHKNQTHLNPSDNNKGIGTTKATPFRYIYSLGCISIEISRLVIAIRMLAYIPINVLNFPLDSNPFCRCSEQPALPSHKKSFTFVSYTTKEITLNYW